MKGIVFAPCPLVRADRISRSGHGIDFGDFSISINEFGESVLDSKKDHIGMNGIDRWLGGVRLHGADSMWRWDRERSRLVRSS